MSNSLTFVRQANPAKDMLPHGKTTKDDMIFFHNFGTGGQELIFHSETCAQTFAKENDCVYKK